MHLFIYLFIYLFIPAWWKNCPLPSLVKVGDARPPPFTLSTITIKAVVYAPAKWKIHCRKYKTTFTESFFDSLSWILSKRERNNEQQTIHPLSHVSPPPPTLFVSSWPLPPSGPPYNLSSICHGSFLLSSFLYFSPLLAPSLFFSSLFLFQSILLY